MTDPTPAVLAAFAWLGRLTGIGRGDVAIHAAVLKGYHDAMARGWHAMRQERDEERARADRLTTAVGEAIDRVDPDDPAALIELLHAWQAVLDARCDTPPAVEQRPSPRPRETTS